MCGDGYSEINGMVISEKIFCPKCKKEIHFLSENNICHNCKTKFICKQMTIYMTTGKQTSLSGWVIEKSLFLSEFLKKHIP